MDHVLGAANGLAWGRLSDPGVLRHIATLAVTPATGAMAAAAVLKGFQAPTGRPPSPVTGSPASVARRCVLVAALLGATGFMLLAAGGMAQEALDDICGPAALAAPADPPSQSLYAQQLDAAFGVFLAGVAQVTGEDVTAVCVPGRLWRFAVAAWLGFGLVAVVCRGLGGSQSTVVMLAMALHTAAEGFASGVLDHSGAAHAEGAAHDAAHTTFVALALHNVCEGMVVAAVAAKDGVSVLGAAGMTLISHSPQWIAFSAAQLLAGTPGAAQQVTLSTASLVGVLGFAIGSIVATCVLELIPEVYHEGGWKAFVVGVAALAAFIAAGGDV